MDSYFHFSSVFGFCLTCCVLCCQCCRGKNWKKERVMVILVTVNFFNSCDFCLVDGRVLIDHLYVVCLVGK